MKTEVGRKGACHGRFETKGVAAPSPFLSPCDDIFWMKMLPIFGAFTLMSVQDTSL